MYILIDYITIIKRLKLTRTNYGGLHFRFDKLIPDGVNSIHRKAIFEVTMKEFDYMKSNASWDLMSDDIAKYLLKAIKNKLSIIRDEAIRLAMNDGNLIEIVK